MNRFAPPLLYAGYIALVIVGPLIAGASLGLWLNAICSAIFILTFAVLTRKPLIAPLAVVFLVTAIVPIIVLVLVGLPVYGSTYETIGALLSAMREHGLLGGLEIAIPFISGIIAAILMHTRYNLTMDGDGERPRHL